MDKKYRNKLYQMITFFSQETQKCGKVKLFKLLYLADFEYFRQTGNSMSGLEYQAWKLGPVSNYLNSEWEEPSSEFEQYFTIEQENIPNQQNRQIIQSKEPFCDDIFTKRELNILNDLAIQYNTATGQELIEVTHQKNSPWDKIWNNGNGRNQPIPYHLLLDELDEAHQSYLKDKIEENQNFIRARNSKEAELTQLNRLDTDEY